MSSKSIGPTKRPLAPMANNNNNNKSRSGSRTQSERGRTPTTGRPTKSTKQLPQQNAKKYAQSCGCTPTQPQPPRAPDSEKLGRKVLLHYYYPDQMTAPMMGMGADGTNCTFLGVVDDLYALSMMQQHHPHQARSQSFRHRPARPMAPGAERRALNGNGSTAESSAERRRSTPTITRRCSLQSRSRVEPRIDAWPEPKQMSEVEERFLQLPDSCDYTRVRQFNIDAKGAVVARGDSFRRKRQSGGAGTGAATVSPATVGSQQRLQQNGGDIGATVAGESRSASVSSSGGAGGGAASLGNGSGGGERTHSARSAPPTLPEPAAESTSAYRICVLGQEGAGKSALIRQFCSSEYRNAFADEIVDDPSSELQHNPNVSINIGGHEFDLSFTECDPQAVPDWYESGMQVAGPFHAYLLVYSIDRKASFRVALRALEELRAEHCPAPVILVGNKMDLERRRTVMENEVKSLMLTYDVAHFQVSVALNHDVDDLLIGIVAQIKESFRMKISTSEANMSRPGARGVRGRGGSDSDFQAAIRRFSRRKKRQMGFGGSGDDDDADGGAGGRGCTMLLADKWRRWRGKGAANC